MMDIHPGLATGPVYLDYNATTPVDPRVVEVMRPYLVAYFGNPSSGHHYAAEPDHAIRTARQQVATLVGTGPDTIVFTGSGSEADNLAIRGVVLAHSAGPSHVITQATEHPAVLATCRALQRLHGTEVTVLPVDRHGLVDPQDLVVAITPRTRLVSIMLANNETGTIQPIAELADIAHARGVPIHTDAAQAVGKIPVDVTALGVDLLTIVGHKMYAPKGIGALYVADGLSLEPVVYGGGQEHGVRAGTENVALTVALGAAADLTAADLAAGGAGRLTELRDRLHRNLVEALPGRVSVNGHPEQRLPNTLNVSIAGLEGEALLAATPGVAASTGSACHAATTDPSPVLTAMGLAREDALAAVRLSVGRWSTPDQVDRAATGLTAAVRRRRQPTAAQPQ
jgi:cysteine desulfurase